MQTLVENKSSRLEYEVLEKYLSGISLFGSEVKSLRLSSASLKGSFVKIGPKGAMLINCQISPYKFSANGEYDPKRTRQLLLKKRS